jgi:HSP20 family protein
MLNRWSDPFRDLERFQTQMNRLLGENAGYNAGYGVFGRGENEGISAAWAPPVDIHETPDTLVFNVEVPGFKESELTLRAENGVLTLEGERKFENKKNEKNFHRVERSYGRFVRSFTLPGNVSTEKVSAQLNDGILFIELPKREEAKPKSIPIGAGQKQFKATGTDTSRMGSQTSRETGVKEREPELVGTR